LRAIGGLTGLHGFDEVERRLPSCPLLEAFLLRSRQQFEAMIWREMSAALTVIRGVAAVYR
jgi:hypothetical protein